MPKLKPQTKIEGKHGRISSFLSKIEQMNLIEYTLNREVPNQHSLVSPLIDFLALGGASIIFLFLFSLSKGFERAPAIAILIAFVINQPHFAHSYQLFYRNFREKIYKIDGGDTKFFSWKRYYLAVGVFLPLVLFIFLSVAIVLNSRTLLGVAVNVMYFLLGWHYIHQGFHILLLSSKLKKIFFTVWEKNVLKCNAYVAWFYGWIHANTQIIRNDFWGIDYYTLALPAEIIHASGLLFLLTSVLTLALLLVKDWEFQSFLPWNGILSYFCALYLWVGFTTFFHKDAFYFIPIFHALQYLLLVWTSEYTQKSISTTSSNKASNYSQNLIQLFFVKHWYAIPIFLSLLMILKPISQKWVNVIIYQDAIFTCIVILLTVNLFLKQLYSFISMGILLGLLGFWLAPLSFMYLFNYDQGIFGLALYPFLFWIFINIHHIFIDFVIWKEKSFEKLLIK